MPGNEVEKRVHNFLAQDNFPQSQHHSQVADLKWPVLNNNLWFGNQREVDVHGSSLRKEDTWQTGIDFEGGCGSHSRQVPYEFNSAHTTLTPEVTDNRFPNKQPDLNGNVYGHQAVQTRPLEVNVSGMDAECDQNNHRVQEVAICEPLQGSASEHHTTQFGLDSSEAPIGFNLFGTQYQMNSRNSGNLQSLMQQQSGYGEMKALHQQVTVRKMQELHRQKELFQLGARQQNSSNSSNCPRFTGQASGNHSHAFVNGTPSSDAPNSPWQTKNSSGNTNRLQRCAPSRQGFSSGLMFSSEKGQELYPEGLVHQQVEQSLHGTPISSSRSSTNQNPRVTKDKPPQGMTYCSNFIHGKQDGAHPEQVNMQNLSSIGTQGFQCKNVFDHTSIQGLRSGCQIENPLQQNSLQRNGTVQQCIEKEVVGPLKLLEEETDAHTPSLHNSAALDPTEEKILFGSDDTSIWDAFNGSIDTNVGSSNFVKSAGFMDGFPSIQSGSWSALMQSAVAETSSSNVTQEKAGFGFQNHHFSAGNSQSSMVYDSGKHKATPDDNKFPVNPTLSTDYVPSSGRANPKNNHTYSVQGFKQFTKNVWQECGAGMLADSSNRQIHQSRAVGSDRLSCGNQTCENNCQSLDVDKNVKTNISSYQIPQQSAYCQQLDKPNNCSSTASLSRNANASFNVYKNENSVYGSQKYNPSRAMHGISSDCDPAAKLQQQMFSLGNPQVTREGSDYKNAAALQVSNNKSMKNEGASQFISNNHQAKSWKHVDPSVKLKESNSGGKLTNPFAKGPQLVEASPNRSEKDESYNIENLSDSYRSNISHNTAVDMGMTGSSDDIVKQSHTDGKEKSTNQVDQRTSASRKFQYHPMGNIDEDVEPSYQTRQDTYSWAMPWQNCKGLKDQDQGLSKLFSQVPKGSAEVNKGQFPDYGEDDKRFDEVTVQGVLPGHGHIMSTSIENSVCMISSNKASHSSQNMLELLDKVDQLEEHHSGMHFSSTECNQLCETANAEISGGSGCHLQQSQSPASQGYGLKLAPPSQQLSVSNHISASPSQTVDSSASTRGTFCEGDKGNMKLASNSPGQLFHSSYEISHAELQNNRTVIDGQTASKASQDKNQANFSSPADCGFSFPSCQFQIQPVAVVKEPESVSQLIDVPFNEHVPSPEQANGYYGTLTGDSAAAPNAAGSILCDGASISQEGATPKMFKSTWMDVPKQQPLLGAQSPDHVQVNQFQHPVMVESTSTRWSTDRLEVNMRYASSELDAGSVHLQGLVCAEEQQSLSGNTDLVQKMNESERGPMIQDLSDAFLSNPASTKTDIEAFGNSQEPNKCFQHNDFTMNQMPIMKVLEQSEELRPKTSKPNNKLPGDKVASKLEQLGNESNDRVEENSTVQSDTAADTNLIGNSLQCPNSSTQSIEHLSAAESLPPDNVGQKFTFSRPKKRKTAASELQTFHNEASQGYLNLQAISMAEANWAKATNRLCEKVGDNVYTIEDGLLVPRARKRLILTTQLMQQLLHAPPAQILSADASLNYETVDYIVARLALADACNLVSRLKSNSDADPVGTKFQADECKTSDGVRNQHFSRVMEDFMSRARKVENEILRLEKRSSVLNLRLEGQDIEKIYVVNRIANIYVRGQVQVADTSSSSAALNAQKPFPEKHVTAVPFPRTFPDKVQCLSL